MDKQEEAIKDGCKDCPLDACMWGGFVGDCPQNSEARKKPEPTDELKQLGNYLCLEHNDNYGQGVCERACAEIDRLTTKREHLLEKVALQEKEIERLTAELAAKNKALEYIACSCQDCPDLDTVLCEHNEYCVNKVAQQALKENDG